MFDKKATTKHKIHLLPFPKITMKVIRKYPSMMTSAVPKKKIIKSILDLLNAGNRTPG